VGQAERNTAERKENVMERLTERDANCADPKEIYGVRVKNHDYISAANRLAAYEDTGLTPEQCENAKTIIESAFSDDTSKVERIRELLKADRDGRLVVLPCKVGDTVYFALLGRIIEKQVFSIVSFSNSTRIYCSGTSEYFRPEDIGKTFFLTRKEAEAALEAMKDE
jgi:hypothetical protein